MGDPSARVLKCFWLKKKIRDEMASGGARDGGWFALAAQYGDDDGIQDLPGGPNFAKPQLQVESGKKKRR